MKDLQLVLTENAEGELTFCFVCKKKDIETFMRKKHPGGIVRTYVMSLEAFTERARKLEYEFNPGYELPKDWEPPAPETFVPWWDNWHLKPYNGL